MDLPVEFVYNNVVMIETKRCLIRPFIEQDLDDFMTYRNDPEWMRFQSFKGLTREAYREALLPEHPIEQGRQLAIIDKALNRLVGDLYVKQDTDFFWIGYTISPRFARQGYAFEAVSALVETLVKDGATCIKASVEPANDASIALLAKFGFTLESSSDDELVFCWMVTPQAKQ